jgi:uncharacterized protein YodC (DUF2158 family)
MTEEHKFKIGDVVRLKSGGPNMTVANYDLYGYDSEKKYLCTWFDDKHKHNETLFWGEQLELVHP